MKRSVGVLASLFSLTLWGSVGCNAPDSELDGLDDVKTESADGKADSSSIATILDFEFDGELQTASSFGLESVIRDHMLYTIGHLNYNNSVGRLDKLVLSNIQKVGSKVTYHAKMPVAWGAKTNLPTSYKFKLPKNADDYAGFTSRYKTTCVDGGAHDVDVGSMWYYYRPFRSGCVLPAADVVEFSANVTVSTVNTNGKYPEYHKVWEDNAFKVVAIFGKYEDGATTATDAGIAAYGTFVRQVRTKFPSATVTPANAAATPGVANPDIEFKATLADGKTVQINVLLVDNVASAPTTFYTRYNALSTRADLIVYNGHAGLGQNVRALARKGAWVAGQYVMLFMNGCDTYAYVDGYLVDARKSINSDDPTGTKYLDFIVNAMPSYFHEVASSTLDLVDAVLASSTQPLTYQSIFNSIDTSQVVLVSGEQDNVFFPGIGGGGGTDPQPGALLDETADVDAGEELPFKTGVLAKGSYTVTLSADGADTGDADLYVKAGAAPTRSVYDCRPYIGGSAETCKVTLTEAKAIFVMVHGYSAAKFKLKVTADGGGGTVPSTWAGLNQSGTVVKNAETRYTTPVLAAGSYRFTLAGTGDADLYVRAGVAPTTALYDCRPYKSGSAEVCTMSLAAPAALHVMVRGYAATSTFTLVGAKN